MCWNRETDHRIIDRKQLRVYGESHWETGGCFRLERTLTKYFAIRVPTKNSLVLDSYPSEKENKNWNIRVYKNEVREREREREREILQWIEGEADLGGFWNFRSVPHEKV